MAKKKGDYEIPFDKMGNQRSYADEYYFIPDRWEPNRVFEDTLTLKSYGRGRSSTLFYMVRKNGTGVCVFVSDFYNMVRSPNFSGGTITGRFTFVKKGRNYGCQLVEE